MQTSFYTSGFLYSIKTHQILLLKSPKEDSTDFLWSTLGGESSGEEEAEVAFQRVVSSLLNLNLKTKDIYPIFDYFHDKKNKSNYVFYAEVKKPQEFYSLNEGYPSWVGFGEISKLLFIDRTKQDVIVGERVINAKWRDDEAKKTEDVSTEG